jgi:NADH-quinone oxidoreductase subunit N
MSAAAVQSIDYVAIGAPLALALLAIGILVLDLFLPARRSILAVWAALAGVVAAFLYTAVVLAGESRSTFCFGGVPGGCSYAVEPWTTVLQLLVLGAAAVVLLLSAVVVPESRLPAGEYAFLLLCSVTGALVLAASRDLVIVVVALEVVSLPVFALVGFRRRDSRSSEAALKLFLVSVVSTAVMLFGISLVYAVRGTLVLGSSRPGGDLLVGDAASALTGVGVVLVLAGFAFKIAAVPFHAWAPDTYVGAPLPVAAYLSVVSKSAGFAGLLVVLSVGFRDQVGVWGPVLAVVAALTMTLGNLVALRQRAAVRLLAWSSIAQAGYMLAPLGGLGSAGIAGGSVAGVQFDDAVTATIAYVCIYAVMTLGAFSVVAVVGRRRPGNLLADYRGMAWTDPWAAGALAFALACLAGVPPGIVGLFAKVVVFRSVVDAGAGWLALVMAVNTVVALYYYLVWAATLFARAETDAEEVEEAATAWPTRLAVGLTTAVVVVWSVAPQLVLAVGDTLGSAPPT